jgi:hypothetical protein
MRKEKYNIEHLKMIEAVIARLANNAFLIKGWFITIFSGLFMLYLQTDTNLSTLAMCFLGLVITGSFYFMNVEYLWLERCYRKKYDEARFGKCKHFDMNIAYFKKSNMGGKYISFTFTIYLMAVICLLGCIILKNTKLFCQLLCL